MSGCNFFWSQNEFWKKILQLYENCLLRFFLIGALGTIVNLTVFLIFADILNVNVNLSSIIAFCLAVTQNYTLNHVWSFRKYVNSDLNFKSYSKYVFVNIFGLILNLIILNLILLIFNPDFKLTAQLFGVMAGTLLNFGLSRYYVFI